MKEPQALRSRAIGGPLRKQGREWHCGKADAPAPITISISAAAAADINIFFTEVNP